jgi:hypothetical protein
VKGRVLKELFVRHMFPHINQQDLLLVGNTDLVCLRDQLLLGINVQQSSFGDSITANIHIKPLYWPNRYAFGISSRIGDFIGRGDTWWDLERVDRAPPKLKDLAEALNKHVLPLFARIRTEADVIAQVFSCFSGPMLSVNDVLLCGDRGDTSALGYIAARDGNWVLAQLLLRQAHRELKRWPECEPEREHIRQTLSLLRSKDELCQFFDATASEQRGEMKLDKAVPLHEVLRLASFRLAKEKEDGG